MIILWIPAYSKKELGGPGEWIHKSVGCGSSVGQNRIIFIAVEVEAIGGVIDEISRIVNRAPGQGDFVAVVTDIRDDDTLILSSNNGPRCVEERGNFGSVECSVVELNIIDETVEVLTLPTTTNPKVVCRGAAFYFSC